MGEIIKSVRSYLPPDIGKRIADRIAERKLSVGDRAAHLEVMRLATEPVDQFALHRDVSPAMRRALLMHALSEAQPASEPSFRPVVGAALTALRDAKYIRDRMDQSLAAVNPVPYDERHVPNAAGAELAGVLEALGPLATFAGAVNSHDYHYAQGVMHTAFDDVAASAKEREASGKLPFATRPSQMPFERLLESGDGEQALDALARSSVGVRDALRGMTALDQLQVLPTAKGAFGAAVQKLKLQEAPVPSFGASERTRALIDRALVQLRRTQSAADADGSPNGQHIQEALKANPLARLVLLGTQAGWVGRDLSSETPRYAAGEHLHLDELNGHTAVANLPVAVAALDGLRRAIRVVDQVTTEGSGYFRNLPSDDAFFLQNMLEAAGRWAIASKDLPEANRIHSGAVAFESTLSLLSALGYRGEESRARQTPVYKTLNAMAFDAGKEFYTEGGTGASAAPVVALRHAGDLLAALHPEAKRDWTAYALSLSQRATIEDVDAVREKLFGGTSSNGTTGEAWREKMGERYKDDAWFVGHVTGRDPKDASKAVAQYPTAAENKAKGLAPLTDAERRDFATTLFAANVTWKSGQAYRGRNDLTRTDSALRDGVYDTYENLIRIDDDPERANYVVLKDAWELREKGQKLLEGKH